VTSTTATTASDVETGGSRFTFRAGGTATIRIDASPDAVYDRVADVTKAGDRSLECRSAEWLPGAAPGTVGARFRGHNKSGVVRWSRKCEVVEADRGRRFAFQTLPERVDFTRADSTIWGYSIEPDGDGSLVTHDYRIVKMAVPGWRQVLAVAFPHHRDMRPHLEHTLRALKTELERTP
jgi:hypothetical protein